MKDGQELWFANAGYRTSEGTINLTYAPGTRGEYWLADRSNSTNAYRFVFHSDYPAGTIATVAKLRAHPVRCVR